MELVDWLDDLCVRFILNIPQEELAEAERICFQIEEAQWFYEDFIRPLDPENLPSLNLNKFYMLIASHCPILCDFPPETHENAFQKFLAYKTRVPVRGAIMLNENMDEVVLVKGWKKNASWSFPRGKINKEEADLDCAIREAYEETGFDVRAAGLITDEKGVKSIDVTMREQHMKLFVFRNVPMDTYFEPRTRKEISKIQWYKISELPTVKKNKHQHEGKGDSLAGNANKFYMVAPFLGPLKKWISQQRKLDKARHAHPSTLTQDVPEPNVLTDTEGPEVDGIDPEGGSLNKLLDLLRRPTTQKPSDLPEVTAKVPTNRDLLTQADFRLQRPELQDEILRESKSPSKDDLLALLRGGPNTNPPPQTPAAQIIEEPKMPHSPPHHHLSRMPTLPSVPQVSSGNGRDLVLEGGLTKQAGMKPAPPMTEAGKLVPKVPISAKISSSTQRSVPSTGFVSPAQSSQVAASSRYPYGPPVSNVGQLAAPPASRLPPPKINPHTANLLSLFNSGSQPVEAPSMTGKDLKSESESEPAKPVLNRESMLYPTQVPSPNKASESAPLVRSVSDHQASLLDLFQKPGAPQNTLQPDQDAMLKLPSIPVELSAIPSPGHSREPSENRKPLHRLENRDTKSKRRSGQRQPPSAPNPSTSATISGPMDIPQFDMIAKDNKSARNRTQNQDVKTEKPLPITILTRPGSSHGASSNVSTASQTRLATASLQQKPLRETENTKQPRTQRIAVKVASPPPAPTLPAQKESITATPSKPFFPQILRRQGREPQPNAFVLDEPSPIHPLPPPMQKSISLKRRHGQDTGDASSKDEHKKSLLSLFTSPALQATAGGVSPLSSTPGGAGPELASEIISPTLLEENQQVLRLPIHDLLSKQSKQEKQPEHKPQQHQRVDPFMSPQLKASNAGVSGSVGSRFDNQSSSISPARAASPRKAPNTSRTGDNDNMKEMKSIATTRHQHSGSGGAISARQTPIETRDKLLGILANIKA